VPLVKGVTTPPMMKLDQGIIKNSILPQNPKITGCIQLTAFASNIQPANFEQEMAKK
jgi:hypothetical protein